MTHCISTRRAMLAPPARWCCEHVGMGTSETYLLHVWARGELRAKSTLSVATAAAGWIQVSSSCSVKSAVALKACWAARCARGTGQGSAAGWAHAHGSRQRRHDEAGSLTWKHMSCAWREHMHSEHTTDAVRANGRGERRFGCTNLRSSQRQSRSVICSPTLQRSCGWLETVQDMSFSSRASDCRLKAERTCEILCACGGRCCTAQQRTGRSLDVHVQPKCDGHTTALSSFSR